MNPERTQSRREYKALEIQHRIAPAAALAAMAELSRRRKKHYCD